MLNCGPTRVCHKSTLNENGTANACVRTLIHIIFDYSSVSFASVVYWLVRLPLDPRVAGLNSAEAVDFKGDKNLQHTFLPMGTKAGGPMSLTFYGMLKDRLRYFRC
jgi:hypothetical protein